MTDQIPRTPGKVVAPCKNQKCSSEFDFGFPYNTAVWLDNFRLRELVCPSCGVKALYSRSDLVVTSVDN
jgi:hypothetical protein